MSSEKTLTATKRSAGPLSLSSNARRAALASFAGGTLEYYDNYIYALASALVFGPAFFPGAGATATLASLATFGVSYVARPLGAVILGHFGDRIGRKNVLVFILVLMGTATFLVGCLPTFAQAGVWAPVLLVTLRIIQGISVGGETAASSSLTIEVAPEGQRAYFTSWAPNGIVGGFALANMAFLALAALPHDQLMSWGWRAPFWASIVVTAAGFVIRRKLAEPEIFQEAKAGHTLVRLPVVEVFRTHWVAILRVTLCSLAFAVDTIVNVFGLSYATGTGGIPQATMLWIMILTHLAALLTQPVLARLADVIGRKAVFIAGNVGSILMVFAFFASIGSKSVLLVGLASFLMVTVAYAAINASYPSLFGEMFSMKVRNTGMALGIQLGLIAAGFAPAIATAMVSGTHAWMPVAIVSAAVSLIAAATTLTAKETFRTPLTELGRR